MEEYFTETELVEIIETTHSKTPSSDEENKLNETDLQISEQTNSNTNKFIKDEQIQAKRKQHSVTEGYLYSNSPQKVPLKSTEIRLYQLPFSRGNNIQYPRKGANDKAGQRSFFILNKTRKASNHKKLRDNISEQRQLNQQFSITGKINKGGYMDIDRSVVNIKDIPQANKTSKAQYTQKIPITKIEYGKESQETAERCSRFYATPQYTQYNEALNVSGNQQISNNNSYCSSNEICNPTKAALDLPMKLALGTLPDLLIKKDYMGQKLAMMLLE